MGLLISKLRNVFKPCTWKEYTLLLLSLPLLPLPFPRPLRQKSCVIQACLLFAFRILCFHLPSAGITSMGVTMPFVAHTHYQMKNKEAIMINCLPRKKGFLKVGSVDPSTGWRMLKVASLSMLSPQEKLLWFHMCQNDFRSVNGGKVTFLCVTPFCGFPSLE